MKDFNRKMRNYKRFITRMAFTRDPIDATTAFVARFASGSLLICLLLDINRSFFFALLSSEAENCWLLLPFIHAFV